MNLIDKFIDNKSILIANGEDLRLLKLNIKYNYLETVARKFVRMNFCCDLYIDRKENIKKQNEEESKSPRILYSKFVGD